MDFQLGANSGSWQSWIFNLVARWVVGIMGFQLCNLLYHMALLGVVSVTKPRNVTEHQNNLLPEEQVVSCDFCRTSTTKLLFTYSVSYALTRACGSSCWVTC